MLAIKYSKRILDCLLCSKKGDESNTVLPNGYATEGGIITQDFGYNTTEFTEAGKAYQTQGYGPVRFTVNSTGDSEAYFSPHTIVFPNAYIGLFLEMPTWNPDGELTYREVSAPSYHRIPLRTTGVDGKRIMKNAEEITTAGENRGKARIENQQMVVFPECTDNDGWGEIKGFGIWSGINWDGGEVPSGDTGEGELVFWDVVEPAEAGDDTITVSKGNVPIIRIGDFQVTLG